MLKERRNLMKFMTGEDNSFPSTRAWSRIANKRINEFEKAVREDCAKVAETHESKARNESPAYYRGVSDIAAAIRGKK